MNRERLWNRDFIAVSLSSFFLFMTFYILAVTLPVFVTDTLHGGQGQIGPVMTSFIVAAVIFRPLAGKWLDELNRRKVLLFSLGLMTASTFLYPFIHEYVPLLLLRFVHGISFGIAATATGAIAVELVPESRKGEGVGYFSLFMSLAMVVGPFLGLTVMEHYNDQVLFIVCIVLVVISFVCGFVIRIPERISRKESLPLKGWRAFIVPGALPISVTASVLAFSYGAITTFLSVYAKANGMGAYSSYFFMVFAAMIVLSRPFTGPLFDRSGPNVLVYPGLALFTLGMLMLSQAYSPLMFLAAAGVLGLGFGALIPSFQTIAIQAAPERRGTATATYFMLFDSGYGIGSSALGVVAAHTGYHTMYFIGGLLVLVCGVLYYLLHHRPKRIQQVSAPLASVPLE